jgi:hypothetical protein
LGNGAGGFAVALNKSLDPMDRPRALALGDFNRDGKPDLAVADFESHNITIMLGNGLGGFTINKKIPVGNYPDHIIVKDLNMDGKDDVVVSTETQTDLFVLFGDGLGGFGPVTNYAGQGGDYLHAVRAGDFNGDGRPDLVVGNHANNNIAIMLNTCK